MKTNGSRRICGKMHLSAWLLLKTRELRALARKKTAHSSSNACVIGGAEQLNELWDYS
jgi:hypothetical protein